MVFETAHIFIAVLLAVNVLYWIWFRRGVPAPEIKSSTPALLPPISVVVCYKNAGEAVARLIAQILKQDYPIFEVIAVDDFSTDEGPRLLSALKDSKLHLLHAKKDRPGKKQALSDGIRAANYPYLLLTDADCMPASDQWIHLMASEISQKGEDSLVLGYGPMNKTHGWLNDFARYETVTSAMTYFSAAASGISYMGVGRNLLYSRQLFDKTVGFASHINVTSGDDDLFVQEAAVLSRVGICLDTRSFVFSDAKQTLREFLDQKTRHISTSVRYSLKHKLMLSVLPLCHVGFYLVLVFGLIAGWYSVGFALCMVAARWLMMVSLLGRPMSVLSARDLVFHLPWLDVLYAFYYTGLPMYGLFRKSGW